jgi:hypothetical protein
MKIVADGEETVVVVPVALDVVEVEVPLRTVPVEDADDAVAVAVHPNRAVKMYSRPSIPPRC